MDMGAFTAKLAEIRAFLEERFDTEMLDERSIEFAYAAGPIALPCYCELNPDMRGFVLRVGFPLPFPTEQRAVVAKYLHRVNYPLPIGNWAIDLDSGEVRWKSGVYFGEGKLTLSIVRAVLETSFQFVYQHVFGLVKLHNGKSLRLALDAVGEDHGVGSIPRKRQEA